MPRLYPQPHPLAYIALVFKTYIAIYTTSFPPFIKVTSPIDDFAFIAIIANAYT